MKKVSVLFAPAAANDLHHFFLAPAGRAGEEQMLQQVADDVDGLALAARANRHLQQQDDGARAGARLEPQAQAVGQALAVEVEHALFAKQKGLGRARPAGSGSEPIADVH